MLIEERLCAELERMCCCAGDDLRSRALPGNCGASDMPYGGGFGLKGNSAAILHIRAEALCLRRRFLQSAIKLSSLQARQQRSASVKMRMQLAMLSLHQE